MTGNTMMAGWASEVITPGLPCWLGGYAFREAPAHAIHDALYARALALGSTSEPFILITCDLLAIDDELLHEARLRIKSLLPAATIWLGATHTHSGPAMALPQFNPAMSEGAEHQFDVASSMSRIIEEIISALVRAAQDAVGRMHVVEAVWASSQTKDVVSNRDHPGSGEDTSLDLVCLYEVSQALPPDGEQIYRPPAVVLGSFPCHPTVLGAENLAVSADLPGAFRRQLRALCGTTTWVMLVTGAAGDMGTRYTRHEQSFNELERLGVILAQQAFEMLATAHTLQLDTASIRDITVELEMKSASDTQVLAEYAVTVRAEMQKAQEVGNTAYARTLETTLQGIQVATHLATEPSRSPRRIELSAIIFGELALVAIPGELYNRLGVEIRHSIAGAVLVLGYTNGYLGYLPTRDAYAQQDYEVLMSPFAAGSGERVRDAAIQLLNQPLDQPTKETG